MAHIRGARIGFCAVAAAAGLLVGATPALAANPPGVAALGSASFVKGGVTTNVPMAAQCTVDGTTTATSTGITAAGVKFGGGRSTCATTVVDPDTETTTTKSESLGERFELSALVSAGGPRLRIAGYRVTCAATQGGTNASWSFTGLTGIPALPTPLPANYVHQLKKSNGTVLATATFNELTLPVPNDGSIALAMLHIRFLPASGVAGEVIVGATACSPTP
ncbi:hypothetical protein [Actinokineospora sp.]|uniref:hypothetical protein n=1 Tax=Actinokineospora sp. TaxID=1872133 RepID=UPI004037DCE8